MTLLLSSRIVLLASFSSPIYVPLFMFFLAILSSTSSYFAYSLTFAHLSPPRSCISFSHSLPHPSSCFPFSTLIHYRFLYVLPSFIHLVHVSLPFLHPFPRSGFPFLISSIFSFVSLPFFHPPYRLRFSSFLSSISSVWFPFPYFIHFLVLVSLPSSSTTSFMFPFLSLIHLLVLVSLTFSQPFPRVSLPFSSTSSIDGALQQSLP